MGEENVGFNHVPLVLPIATPARREFTQPGASARAGREWWQGVWDGLFTLHLFGACAIVAFGWAMGLLLRVEVLSWAPLWFCAALLVYNVDRLRRDPSDCVNTPAREATALRLRRWVRAMAVAAAAGLVGFPIWRRDWLSLGLVSVGSVICLQYSLPRPGFRLKDVPLLKTFFAPTLVTGAIFGLPLLHGYGDWSAVTLGEALWAWGLLMGNMILCDARDVEGDRLSAVVSLPSLLGLRGARQLLYGVVICLGLVAGLLAIATPSAARQWTWLGATSCVYLAALIRSAEKAHSERFYELWVEGLLFVPAMALICAR